MEFQIKRAQKIVAESTGEEEEEEEEEEETKKNIKRKIMPSFDKSKLTNNELSCCSYSDPPNNKY